MTRSAVLMLAGCALAACASLWLWCGHVATPEQTFEPVPARPEQVAASAPEQLALEPQAQEQASRERLAPAVEVFTFGSPDSDPSAAADATKVDETPRVFSGTMQVLDASGRLHAAESCSFGIESSKGFVERTIEVRNGTWSSVFGPNASFQLTNVRLGGRAARPEDEQRVFQVSKPGDLDIVVRWLPDVLVHVRSKATERELDDIEYFARTSQSERETTYPPSSVKADGLSRSAHSPIVLVPTADEAHPTPAVYYVRARDHAWGRFEFDERRERFIDLEPAGTLTVDLRGRRGTIEVDVHEGALESGWVRVASRQVADDRVTFDSLPAHSYWLLVNTSGGAREQMISRKIEVAPGQETTVEIDVAGLAVPPRPELPLTTISGRR